MSSALGEVERGALERLMQQARRLLESDLTREAEGKFGVHLSDGTIEDEVSLHLDATALGSRRDIVEVLEFLEREEGDPQEGAARLIREAAFTHLNRLVAIRIAEDLGLLPPSLAKGSDSAGYQEILEVAPMLARDGSDGYWRFLLLCGDELAADLPQLFDPRNPLLQLRPSAGAVEQLVDLMEADELGRIWGAPDALGWAYQFFNSGDERRKMRDASGAPRNSRELAVRNQFFTPSYVVDFLIQNSLGRRLLEADPASGLLRELPLILDPPRDQGEPIDLADVRILDPACGSGHFLLGAYDLLEKAWELQGVSAAEAAPRIVSSLWGIDIDSRCAQVASAAVMFRARRHCKNARLPTPHVITARALPEPAGGWDDLLKGLPNDRRSMISAMRDALDQAPVLGPLLQVEVLLASEIAARVPEATDDAKTLFGAMGVANDAFGEAESDVLTLLQEVADRAQSGAAERLMVAEAQDAIRFVEAMRHRYDVVLMNPPFGEPAVGTKEYLSATYPWAPTKDANLFALFVGRGAELSKTTGFVGAITSRAGMFLTTFETWRREVLLGNGLVTLADLGFGVMHQALVEAAAYVIAVGRFPTTDGVFVRLLRDTNRPKAMDDVAAAVHRGEGDSRLFRTSLADFQAVPGSPLSYWMGASIRRLFRDFPQLEGTGMNVRVGLQTGDDFRFVRAAWEVRPDRILGSEQSGLAEARWAPFAKGGEYSPYWSDIHLLVDWADHGSKLRDFRGSVVRNPQFYFRSGLTWPRRTNSGFGPRVLPFGAVFADKGPAVIPDSAGPYALLAWLSSRLVQALIDSMVAAGEEVSSGGASRSYEVGLVQKLPWPIDELFKSEVLVDLTTEVVRLRRAGDEFDETTSTFICPTLPEAGESIAEAAARRFLEHEEASLAVLEATYQLDEIVAGAVGLDDVGKRYLDEELGPHPFAYEGNVVDDAQFEDLYTRRIDSVINELIQEKGGSRAIANLTYFADRRLEVLAHGLRVSPKALIQARRRLGLLPPGEMLRAGQDVFSYLVGAAFGRWDLRIGLDPSLAVRTGDPFSGRPACAPGMLVSDNGLPSRISPADYPILRTDSSLLVDEVGHDGDIEEVIMGVADVLFDDPDTALADVLALLGSKSVRGYVRRGFFREHLSRYTKSRRKAPIYWPLSVPSKNWGVWIYAPEMTRETLFAVTAEAARREDRAAAEIARLEVELAGGQGGRSPKTIAKALEAESSLEEELRRFRTQAEHVAGLGWEPDLDDGLVLNAAPLADLFVGWKEPAKYRQELRGGSYDWSTVSTWADRL